MTTQGDPKATATGFIKELSHIATLPDVTMNIIRLVEDPTSTAKDLHAAIAVDPALSTRVLKVVNSSFYGLPRQISSIDRSIALLGLNAVKNIAIAASLAKLFRGGAISRRFDAKDVWTHSIATAAASRMIAESISKATADEAFLAGLLHDIGIVIELQVDRNKLGNAINELEVDADDVPVGDLRELERAEFGCAHTDFGAALCESWKFPHVFGAVCGGHHDPTEVNGEARRLAWTVHVADRLAAGGGFGFRLDLPDITISNAALDGLGLGAAEIEGVASRLAAVVEEASATMAA